MAGIFERVVALVSVPFGFPSLRPSFTHFFGWFASHGRKKKGRDAECRRREKGRRNESSPMAMCEWDSKKRGGGSKLFVALREGTLNGLCERSLCGWSLDDNPETNVNVS